MPHTTIRLLACLLACVTTLSGPVRLAFAAEQGAQQQTGSAASALQAVAAGEDWALPEDAAAVKVLVAELAALVAWPDHGTAELAIRTLAAMGPRAAPAVDDEEAEKQWSELVERVKTLDIQWDQEQQRFALR